MTKRSLLSAAVTILGLICAIRGVASLTNVLYLVVGYHVSPQGYTASELHWYLGLWVAEIGLFFVAAAALLRFSRPIAAKLVPDDPAIQIPAPGVWAGQAFDLSLRVLGIVCLIWGLPKLVGIAILSVPARGGGNLDLGVVGPGPGVGVVARWAGLVTAIANVAIGGYLLKGAKHLVRALYPAQTSGIQAPEEK